MDNQADGADTIRKQPKASVCMKLSVHFASANDIVAAPTGFFSLLHIQVPKVTTTMASETYRKSYLTR